MGWSLNGEQDLFSLEEMIQAFRLENMHLGGPVFDMVKLQKINQHYLATLSEKEFVGHLQQEVFSYANLAKLYPLYRERLNCFDEWVEKAGFFFSGHLDLQVESFLPKKKTAIEVKAMLETLLLALDDQDEWEAKAIGELLESHRVALGWKAGEFFMPIRIIVSGRKDSPPLNDMLEVLGREMVRARLRDAINRCG
jgi:glutamyl-tRNA synthetase